MSPQDLVKLLESLTFVDLSLVSLADNSYTYKYGDYNHAKLEKALGKPAIAGQGKVAVFQIPGTGKIGVSPANSVVRLIVTGVFTSLPKAADTHLSKQATTKELSLAYTRAQGNQRFQLQFLTELWEHFNQTKFGGRLSKPRLEVSDRPTVKVPKGTRGAYQAGRAFGPGILWIAKFLFNAREIFFNEIVLHEMCHQAVNQIDHKTNTSDGGHGPEWQKWMVHVGLDPRRYDPTDDVEYQDTAQKADTEAELSAKYGPRAKPEFFKELQPLRTPVYGPVIFEFRGRALEGVLDRSSSGYEFRWSSPKGAILTWKLRSFPNHKFYRK